MRKGGRRGVREGEREKVETKSEIGTGGKREIFDTINFMFC